MTPYLGFCEPVSSLMHLTASVLVLAGAPLLLRLGGTRRRIVALAGFIASASTLLALSGIYHSLEPGPARDMAQRLDHGAIWTLIVGTFTPVVVVILRGNLRRLALVLIWTIAVAGVVGKTVFWHEIPEWVGLVFYVGLGWMGALSSLGVLRHSGRVSVGLLVAGGVSYTLGAILEFARTPVLIPNVFGPHELFHLFIVGGVVLHWVMLKRMMRADLPVQGTSSVRWWDRPPKRWLRPPVGPPA